MVRFGSILSELIFGQIRSSYQNKQLSRKFWFELIQVSGPLSEEHIADVRSNMGPGRSVQILGQFFYI